MQIGIVGLGRMGGGIARRLMKAGHTCVVFDKDAATRDALTKEGAIAAGSLAELVSTLGEIPRAVWVMLPAGAITEATVGQLGGLLARDDIVIDGGNTFYKDDIRRARTLAANGIRYVDVGTSGGVWGLERGYCMMIGGDKEAVDRLDPIFAGAGPGHRRHRAHAGPREAAIPASSRATCTPDPSGAGHFVKMVHNGIEYGLMQAYAEGFDILRNKIEGPARRTSASISTSPDIAEVWRRGSVIPSWLLDLAASALAKDRTSKTTPASSRIPAKAAGPSTPRSTRRCRRSADRRAVTRVSVPARNTPSRKVLSAMRTVLAGTRSPKSRQSNDEYRRKPAARSSEIGGLALIEPRRCEQNLARVSVEPDIHLALHGRAVEFDHSLSRCRESLRNISAFSDAGPYSSGHFVAAIHGFAAVAGQRLEEQVLRSAHIAPAFSGVTNVVFGMPEAAYAFLRAGQPTSASPDQTAKSDYVWLHEWRDCAGLA